LLFTSWDKTNFTLAGDGRESFIKLLKFRRFSPPKSGRKGATQTPWWLAFTGQYTFSVRSADGIRACPRPHPNAICIPAN
jgi:hypothetical protein